MKQKLKKRDKFGNKLTTMGNITWYTNLETIKRKNRFGLSHTYKPKEYPKYDNYDAVEVSRVVKIPYDYEGVMGVPITFLGEHNPDQFEIIERSGDLEWAENECDFFTPPKEELRKVYKKANKTWRVQNAYLLDGNGNAKSVYSRIFIRNKTPGVL